MLLLPQGPQRDFEIVEEKYPHGSKHTLEFLQCATRDLGTLFVSQSVPRAEPWKPAEFLWFFISYFII